MIIDPKKEFDPLLTRDWTRMGNTKAFFQKASYEYPPQGTTTENEKHLHQYQVDEDGNGWALEAVDPNAPGIHHKHEIKKWVIESAQSNCWPNCEDEHGAGNTGVPPHVHSFSVRTPVNGIAGFDRYSAIVLTDAITTDGSDARLDEIKNAARSPGAHSLLQFYNKVDRDQTSSSVEDVVEVEDWYISERPLSKIKILISIKAEVFEELNGETPPEFTPLAANEIYLNTWGLEKKIKGVNALLNKYDVDIQSFQGKVQGLDLPYQVELLSQFIPHLATLIQSNGLSYDVGRSDLLTFGIDEEYKVLYAQLNDGTCFKDLYINFNKFEESSAVSDSRTVYFLSRLEEIYGIYSKDEEFAWSEFFESFVLNPPIIDFTELARESCPEDKTTAQAKFLANQKKVMTEKEFLEERKDLDNDTIRSDMKRKLDTSAEFVGDTMVSGLDTVVDGLTSLSGYATRNPSNYVSSGIWKDLLNKIPIQNLIAAALECLGFKGFEYINLSKQFLNQMSSFLGDVAKLHDIPAFNFPDDFPVANYMKNLGKQIVEALLQAVMSVLIEALVGIIEELLNMCNECALQNEAEGKGRMDGLNFGALNLDKAFGEAFVGGTLAGLSKAIATGTGFEQKSAQLQAETDRWAKNPVFTVELFDDKGNLLKGVQTDGLPDDYNLKRIQQKTEASKQELSSFLRASSTILTPGEMGNMLLGCGVGKSPLNAVESLLGNYPLVKNLSSGQPPHKFILKLFADLGILLGPNPILLKVKEATDSIPVELQCLTDADDLALRKKLLSKKGLSKEQVDDQVKKSQDRKNLKLKELSAMLEKDNLLDGITPDVYCKLVFRKSDGTIVPSERVVEDPVAGSLGQQQWISKETGEQVFKGVKQGLMEKDPPSFTFMMDQVLDTIYDGITMNFNQDLNGFLPALTKDTTRVRTIRRTKTAFVNNKTQLIVNPEWISLVKDSSLNYEFGALPAEATVPGGTYRVTDSDESWYDITEAAGDVRNANDENFIGHDNRLSDEQNEAMAAGQMEMGQGMPTGEQEGTWETLNSSGPASGTMGQGRRRINEYGDVTNVGDRRRLIEYTKKFGYSPIPVTVKESGPKVLAPGLKDAFKKMCTTPELFEISDLQNQYHLYALSIPNNIFEASEVDIGAIHGALSSPEVFGSAGDGSDKGWGSDEDFAAGRQQVAAGLQFLNNAEIDLNYVVPFDVPLIDGLPTDTYGVSIAMESQPNGALWTPSLVLYRATEEKKLKTPIINALQPRNLQTSSLDLRIPQEKLFVALNQDIWNGGGTIYQNGVRLGMNKPDYAQGIQLSAGWPHNLNVFSELKDFYLDRRYGPPTALSSTYDSLWKDFYCSLTNNISESPFMDLKKMATLNLIPMNEMGQAEVCDPFPGLLDIETIKERVKVEYGLVQCIETCFPNTDGLGTNKDNPFEKANLGGAVLLTVRTYVLEILLRSIFSFYYFRYKAPEDVDSLLVSYIMQILIQDITEKDFIAEFSSETVKLYNRNAPNMSPPRSQIKNITVEEDAEGKPYVSDFGDFELALEYFIRFSTYGVSNRLTKTVGSMGDTSLDSILINEWIPSYAVPGEIGSRVLGNDPPDPPDPGGIKVRPDQALQLVGQGTLSTSQINKFNWAGPSNGGSPGGSYTYKWALGFLFRKYYAWTRSLNRVDTRPEPKGKIWSMEGPQRDEINPAQAFQPESAMWLGKETVRTPNKQSVNPNQQQLAANMAQREWWTLWDAGFLKQSPSGEWHQGGNTHSLNKKTREFEAALNPRPLTNPNTGEVITPYGEPENSVDSPYEFGVSIGEQYAMAIYLRMIGSAVAASPTTVTIAHTDPEFSGYVIEPAQDEVTGVTPFPFRIYPGYFLKKESRAGYKTPHTFIYGDVWDRKHWASTQYPDGTGREPPQWLQEMGNTRAATDANPGSWDPPSRIGQGPILGGGPDYNLRYQNNAYMSQVWSDDPRWDRPGPGEGRDNWLSLEIWNAVGTGRGPPRANFVRWFYIEGKWIGPWRNDRTATHGTNQVGTDINGNPLYQYVWDELLAEGVVDGQWRLTDPLLICGSNTDACGLVSAGHVPAMPVTIGDNRFVTLRDPVTYGFARITGQGPPSPHQVQLLNRAVDLLYIGMPYLSLLDFDISSIRSILIWEKEQWLNSNEYIRTLETARDEVTDAYDRWIDEIDGAAHSIANRFRHTPRERNIIAQRLRQRVVSGGITTREMKSNPGKSFENGNFITEYYLRVEELPYQGIPYSNLASLGQSANQDYNVEWVSRTARYGGQEYSRRHKEYVESFSEIFSSDPRFQTATQSERQVLLEVERGKWRNSNFIDKNRNEFLKGVVNIDKFQEYIDQRFENGEPITGTGPAIDSCTPVKLTKALIRELPEYEECGKQQAFALGIRLNEEGGWVLGDFFKKVSIGIRVSYVTALKDFEPRGTFQPRRTLSLPEAHPNPSARTPNSPSDCWRYHPADPAWSELTEWTNTEPDQPFKEIRDYGDWENAAMKEKAFFVKEYCDDCALRDDDNDPNTPGIPSASERWVHVVPIVSVEQEFPLDTLISDVADTVYLRNTVVDNVPITDNFGFFKNQYYERLNSLRDQMKETDEFKALFKYFFPVDRMLSLCNMYSSTYLSSYKGLDELFDGTKINLKRLFFALLNSGNYPSDACGPTNKDLQTSALNGLPIAGLAAALALMMVKASLLVFKGFTEVYDINVAVSRKIVDAIHLSNKLIAQGQMMANQAQQVGAGIGQMASDLENMGDSCKTNVPGKPPDDWFDPIEENFIPEPPIFLVGMALLPITLLPMIWPGLPVTPFGLAYWGLDLKPAPNWLNAIPPADWLDKLFNKDEAAQLSSGTELCNIDIGIPPPRSDE